MILFFSVFFDFESSDDLLSFRRCLELKGLLEFNLFYWEVAYKDRVNDKIYLN